MKLNQLQVGRGLLAADDFNDNEEKPILRAAQNVNYGHMPHILLTASQMLGKHYQFEPLKTQQLVCKPKQDISLGVTQQVIKVEQLEGAFFSVTQAVNDRKFSGAILSFSQNVLKKRNLLPYRATSHINGEAYNVIALINGVQISPCRLFKEISITYSEGESAKATLNILEKVGLVDLYEFYNQTLQLFVKTEKDLTCIFTGIIDVPDIDLSTRKMQLTATNDRKELLNKMDKGVVSRIGFWSESVFGKKEDYKNLAAEIDDRMTTIPASLDFDASGNGYVTEWKPKTVPDFTLGDCSVYKSGMKLSMGSASGIINTVKIKLGNRYERLFHRGISYYYEYKPKEAIYELPCYIAWEGPPPKYDDIASAAKGAGWGVGYFKTKGTPQPGWYDCGVPTHWDSMSYTYEYSDTGTTDANGNHIMAVIQKSTDGSTSELYCMEASWRAMKRWRQSIEETYDIIISNAASVKLHGKRDDELSYTISQEADKNDIAKHWEETEGYAAPYGTLQSNGDYTTNIDNVIPGEFARASECAFNIGYTKILETHRNNTVTLDCKLIPFIGLQHTVFVNLKQFKGNVKVKEYTHTIDLKNKTSRTEVVGAFFKNPLGQNQDDMSLWNVASLQRPELPLSPYQHQYVLGDYVIPYKAEIIENDDSNKKLNTSNAPATGKPVYFLDSGTTQRFYLYNCNGFIRRESGYYYHAKKVKRPYAFRVKTPDIEDLSRDTAELKAADTALEVNVFDTPVEVKLI